jgi:hypothetical protein
MLCAASATAPRASHSRVPRVLAGDRLAVEGVEDLLGGDLAHVETRLRGDARRMRAYQHVVELQQRMLARRRLGRPNVKPGPGDLPAPQGIGKRGLVMKLATGRGDEIGMWAHQRQLLRPHHAAAFRRQRTVDRYIVAAAQELVELDLFGAALTARRRGEIGIAGEHLHGKQAAAKFGDAAADIAEADETRWVLADTGSTLAVWMT